MELGKPIALYTLVPISPSSLKNLLATTRFPEYEGPPGGVVQLALPRHDFSGQSLRAVCDHHLAKSEGAPDVLPDVSCGFLLHGRV